MGGASPAVGALRVGALGGKASWHTIFIFSPGSLIILYCSSFHIWQLNSFRGNINVTMCQVHTGGVSKPIYGSFRKPVRFP